jgi:hypothetical protein
MRSSLSELPAAAEVQEAEVVAVVGAGLDLTASPQGLEIAHSVPAGLPAVPVSQEKGSGGGGAAEPESSTSPLDGNIDLTQSQTEQEGDSVFNSGNDLNWTETAGIGLHRFVDVVTGTQATPSEEEAARELAERRTALGEQLRNLGRLSKEAQQKADTEIKAIQADAMLQISTINIQTEEAVFAANQAAAAAFRKKETAEAEAAEAVQRTAKAEAAAAAAERTKATAEAKAAAAVQRQAEAAAAAERTKATAEAEAAAAERTKEQEAVAILRQLEAKRQAASNYTALGVSAIIGIIASIYSQTLQNMLFGKIFFGKSILFGYALPMVNLAAASVMFGLVFFGLSLAVISTAKFAEDKPLFRSIRQSNYFRPALSALSATITYLTLTKYAVAIQLALFGKIFLGGTILANLGFAIIPATIIGLLAYTAVYTPNNFKQLSALYAFAAGALFASPILQALAGIAITGSTLVVIASSIAVGATAAALTFGLIYGAAKAKTRNPQAGFTLTMYAVSFVLLSIYASPIQIALFGRAMMAVTPLLSNISFGAIASVFTSAITTLLYKTTEEIVTPALMNTYETSGSFKDIAATAATSARAALARIGEALGYTINRG